MEMVFNIEESATQEGSDSFEIDIWKALKDNG